MLTGRANLNSNAFIIIHTGWFMYRLLLLKKNVRLFFCLKKCWRIFDHYDVLMNCLIRFQCCSGLIHPPECFPSCSLRCSGPAAWQVRYKDLNKIFVYKQYGFLSHNTYFASPAPLPQYSFSPAVGGGGGTPFSTENENGPITGIRLWENTNSYITGSVCPPSLTEIIRTVWKLKRV